MQEVSKVFSSDITRGPKSLRNNLYDLLDVVPAQPTVAKKRKESTCDFQPKIDKYYTPKKSNRLKVKTIRDIRNVYERDIYSYLPSDLEKQQNILLGKITGGSSRHEQTKLLSTNIIKSQSPISRSAWQMLMNLNPEGQVHCIQFVLWNGKLIRVNGSKGGKSKFLFTYDLANNKAPLRNKAVYQNKGLNKKKGLLRNSLTVKFKPGPLTKKKFLDDSYQKYSVGYTELINLPKAELDIQPTYGVVLEPTITHFLQNLREVDGQITEKWAEFAVTVLGTLNNTSAMQNKMQRNVKFELNYKSNQRRILMRRDVSDSTVEKEELYNATKEPSNDISLIISEVTTVINNILDTVEISLQQDTMYTGEDDPREFVQDDSTKGNANNLQAKDKIKRNLELDRLDVTVIRLPDLPQGENIDTCRKAQCFLGCICSSLQSSYKLSIKQHCGRIECMFKCKCDFLKYKVTESLEKECSELIPGLLELDNKINLRLAKEEQKFHQTVIMTGEKSVLLKSQKRNCKASKRYADFYCNMNLKSDVKTKRVLSVVAVKLNCENIEPWCMVHSLYQCFCQGKFTSSIPDKLCEPTYVNETIVLHHEETSDNVPSKNEEDVIKNTIRNRIRPERSRTIFRRFSMSEDSRSDDVRKFSGIPAIDRDTCARIKPYQGRKYYNSYYICTNKKILEMEKNDLKLHRKMMRIINNMENKEKSDSVESNDNSNTSLNNSTHENKEINISQQPSTSDTILPPSLDDTIVDIATAEKGPTQSAILSNACNISSSFFDGSNSNTSAELVPKYKPSLISWLGLNYKHYKERLERGIVKASLDPPKHGKMGLYPWEFILSRYRERKNLFLITKQSPYRVFMAVDAKNAFFDSCINIDDIRFADLHKYPATAKNLLTNATDLKDNFCILRGLTHCWEWIGSANVKNTTADCVTDPRINQEHSQTIQTHEDKINSDDSCDVGLMELDVDENNGSTTEVEDNSETSKWFVMTVENDFSEIQFNKRGFYVKYESIIKAINVANMSGKTVCLSSQKCSDQNCGPQFGIYAIPNASEYCVFVGPYDKEDALGIEIVKSISNVRKLQRTRGVWIATKKVDNLKVIDNPLSFMPRNKSDSNEIVALVPDFTSNTTRENSNEDTNPMHEPNENEIDNSAQTSKLSPTKLVKPIKIRRTNGFYHLQSKNFLKQVTLKPSLLNKTKQIPGKQLPKFYLKNHKHQDIQSKNLSEPPLLVIDPSSSSTIVTRSSLIKTSIPLKKSSTNENILPQHYLINVGNKMPEVEILPKIKIVDVYSESTAVPIYNVETKKNEGGMFVLKPEEINKRLIQNKGLNKKTLVTKNENDTDMNQDIENFLATSKICTLSNSDIYIVSDDEDACTDSRNIICSYEDVWIQCRNIDLGWIRGRRNAVKELSFEFPGFKYTDFYIEGEAFSKINQVLSRKIFIPKNINLEWQVIESEEELNTKHMLNPEKLGADFVLTKTGLRHKQDLVAQKNKRRAKTANEEKQKHSNKEKQELGVNIKPLAIHQHMHASGSVVGKVGELLNNLEEQSRTLENEGDMLLSEFKKKGGILRSFRNVSNDHQRDQVAETLQNIMSPISPKNEMDINMSPVSFEHDS